MEKFVKVLISVVLFSALSLEKAKADEGDDWRTYCTMEEKFTWVFNSTIRFLLSVRCQRFTTFPETSFKSKEVEVLYFGQPEKELIQIPLFNKFRTLKDGVIRDAFDNFPNLRRVYLTDCSIDKIEKGAFAGGDKLIVLTLNKNSITNLDLGLFLDVFNLEYLDLGSNPLGDFQNGAQFPKMKLKWLFLNNCGLKALEPTLLDNLVDLRSLDLGGNQIVALESRFFTNLKNLQELNLEGNQFAGFDENIICDLKHLSFFGFHKNPLFCNCSVIKLIELFRERNIYFREPDCSFKTTAYIHASKQSDKNTENDSSLCSYFEKSSLKECREPSTEFKEGYCRVKKNRFGGLTMHCTGYRNGLPKAMGILVNYVTDLSMDAGGTNNIKILKNGELQQTNLPSLSYLDLEGCQIQDIEKGAFKGGKKIARLWLEQNLLTNIDAGVFSELENLYSLNLNNNPIRSFKKGSKFPALSNLQELGLENCKLTTLETGIFENLKSLQIISLEENQIKTLNTGVFSQVTSIRGCIRLEGNPWTCKDFQFKKMVRDLQDRKIHFTGKGEKCGGHLFDCTDWNSSDCIERNWQELKDLGCSRGDMEEDLGSSDVLTKDAIIAIIAAASFAAVFLIFLCRVVILARKNGQLRFGSRDVRENPRRATFFAKSITEAQAMIEMSDREILNYSRGNYVIENYN